MIYLLDPKFSDVPTGDAENFLRAASPTLEFMPTARLAAMAGIDECEPTAADGVVFFNPIAQPYAADIEELISRAQESGAVISPIALREEWRRPEGTAGSSQSFDVTEHLRNRQLSAEQIEPVAEEFARQVISHIQPTYSRSRLRLFLSHRREDGEGLVAKIDAKLSQQHQRVFRDLIDVQTGEQAQERIEEALETADVLVFFETPLAHESWWIAREISLALGRNIPIVWVQVGEPSQTPLPAPPGSEPHIKIRDADPSDESIQSVVYKVLRVAFELSRDQVRESSKALRKIKTWATNNDATVETLDARRSIFELRRTPGQRKYPLRPEADVVQFFGHKPTEEDLELLGSFLEEQGLGPHGRECRSFDAAVLIYPGATSPRTVGDWSVIDSPKGFLGTLEPLEDEEVEPVVDKTMLLLGAFPNTPRASDQVAQAVRLMATSWLSLGGSIVFGGHPTFTPLILESSELAGVADPDRITIYQSAWFPPNPLLLDVERRASVITTAVAETLADSLTVMRTEMCGISAQAAVAIGGRTSEGGAHEPGIDQEIALARASGSPIFIVGAAGGRSAEIGALAKNEAEPWESLANPLSVAENEQLYRSEEFGELAGLIFRSTEE